MSSSTIRQSELSSPYFLVFYINGSKAEETIIDTSVRKTWELNSDQFELRNPQWTSYINDITARAISELGFISNNVDAVQAELYKLLIYEKGAMFKLHKEYVCLQFCLIKDFAHRTTAPKRHRECLALLSSVSLLLMKAAGCN